MTFLDKLKDHAGGLVRIKSGLYWYDGTRSGPDGDPGRICLLLDTHVEATDFPIAVANSDALLGPDDPDAPEPATVLLFIDGMSKWVLVWTDAVEIIE